MIYLLMCTRRYHRSFFTSRLPGSHGRFCCHGYIPTDPFAILEPRNLSIDEICVVDRRIISSRIVKGLVGLKLGNILSVLWHISVCHEFQGSWVRIPAVVPLIIRPPIWSGNFSLGVLAHLINIIPISCSRILGSPLDDVFRKDKKIS